MWKKFTIAAFGVMTLNACAGPATDSFEAARQEELNRSPISQGACDSIGQLLPGSSMPKSLTLGTVPVTLEASAAPIGATAEPTH